MGRRHIRRPSRTLAQVPTLHNTRPSIADRISFCYSTLGYSRLRRGNRLSLLEFLIFPLVTVDPEGFHMFVFVAL
jgi:hypothetical protein